MLSPVLTVLRGLVFPPVCEGCGALAPASLPHSVCASCTADLRPIQAPACPLCARHWPVGGKCPHCRDQKTACDAVHVAFAYEGALRPILHAYKFSRRRALGRFLSDQFCRFAQERLEGQTFDAVIAVPTDPAKTAERGFHPPLDLARQLAKTLGIPNQSSWLGARAGQAQIHLSREERRQNVRGRFFVRGHTHSLKGQSILLVDDVLTTGSTVGECAWVLQGTGAASITAICLARGDQR